MLCHSTPQHAFSLSLSPSLYVYIYTHTHTTYLEHGACAGIEIRGTPCSTAVNELFRLYEDSMKALLGLDQGSIKALLRID
jgi:hypothetical protein